MKKITIIIIIIIGMIKFHLMYAQDLKEPSLEQIQEESPNERKEEENKKVLYKESWTPIEGILKYRLEIYDLNNNPVLIEETEKNQIEVSIYPGKYKKRLGLINKFNKLFLYTDWKDFEIMELPTPTVSYVEKKDIELSKEKDELLISVNGLAESTKIYIRNKEQEELIPVQYKQIDTNRLKLEIIPTGLKQGEYSIIIKNSEKKFVEIENAIILKETNLVQDSKSNIPWYYLMPGLPQKKREEYKKANFLQWGFIGSMIFTGYFYDKSLKYKTKYNSYSINSNLLNFSTSLLKSTNGVIFYYYQTIQLNNTVAKYNLNKSLYHLGLSVSTMIYAYHIYDVIHYELFVEPKTKEMMAQITINF